jgi:uncharacterized protein
MGASPWVVSVHEQQRNPGVQRRVHLEAPLPGLALSSAAVPDGEDVVADLAVEAMTDGRITATGTVGAPWTGECRRCLEPVSGTVAAEVQEVFEPDPGEDADTYALDGDRVDLEPMVRDAVLLALPLAPLCEAGCRGPDPDDQPVTVEGEDAGEERPLDPRWSVLSTIDLPDA